MYYLAATAHGSAISTADFIAFLLGLIVGLVAAIWLLKR